MIFTFVTDVSPILGRNIFIVSFRNRKIYLVEGKTRWLFSRLSPPNFLVACGGLQRVYRIG